MKILIATGIYPPDSGGPATYSCLLAEELPKIGVGAGVLSFGEVRKYPKIIRHILFFLKLLFRARNFDLIYAQDPVSVGLPSLLVSKILRKNFFLKVVGDYAWEQQQQIFSAKYISLEDFQFLKFDWLTEIRKKIERCVAKNAFKIIVPSEYLKKIIVLWGVDSKKIFVVYNAFSLRGVAENKNDLREDFGFCKPTLFSVGRLVPWKGFEALVDAMLFFPDCELRIAGDGPDKNSLEQKIDTLGLVGRVKLLGRLERSVLLKQIKASDIFILNTGYEGFSHQLLEVMSVATPIITTRVGGNLELIESDKNGLLVEYNNQAEIKNAIKKLLDQKDLADTLSRNGLERIKNFNKEKMLKELLAVFRD